MMLIVDIVTHQPASSQKQLRHLTQSGWLWRCFSVISSNTWALHSTCLETFSLFCKFLCRRLLLGYWQASINSVSFPQVDQIGPSITIENRVITFQNNLVQPPSNISLFSSWTHSHGPLHYCWITLQKPIGKSVAFKVNTWYMED